MSPPSLVTTAIPSAVITAVAGWGGGPICVNERRYLANPPTRNFRSGGGKNVPSLSLPSLFYGSMCVLRCCDVVLSPTHALLR